MTEGLHATEAQPARPLVVWRFVDGKPGHENQSLGLVQALADLLPIEAHDVVSGGARWRAVLNLLLGRCRQAAQLPAPDLLVGAGHATHMDMLACRRARGGRAVVLMRPSLPLGWFDLCVIPEHDRVREADGVFLSRGVLNPVRSGAEKDEGCGLVLVGGPSSHYGWDERLLADQLAKIFARDGREWLVATSRRTPESTLRVLQQVCEEKARLVPSEETEPGWLARQLQKASAAWITEDSVSMLYEALTAGAACGVLSVPQRRASRVRRGLETLLAEGVVLAFDDWLKGGALPMSRQPFNEATRCAAWIRNQWFAS